MNTHRIALLGFLLLGVIVTSAGQEVNCTIHVNVDAVPTSNRDLLVNFGNDVEAYLKGFNWGGGESSDKVDCTLNIFFQSMLGENRYSAQVFIGSTRPRFKSDQNSAVVRLMDDLWEFNYIKDRPINHNPYVFHDLASFLDFYMYLIMGYDYDTYDRLGGTALFQKAADIARLGRATGMKSWQPATTSYSRAKLIEELLSPQFESVRAAAWHYHFNGLDSLSSDPPRAYANMLDALESIGNVRQSVDPRNLVIRTWFEAKYLEMAQLFLDYPDPNVYYRLEKIDPANQKTYEEYRLRAMK